MTNTPPSANPSARVAHQPTDSDYLTQSVAEVVVIDSDVQEAVVGLAKLMIGEAAKIMSRGTPTQKAALVTKFLPYMARSLVDSGADEAKEELRAEFIKMRNEMMHAARFKRIETSEDEIDLQTAQIEMDMADMAEVEL